MKSAIIDLGNDKNLTIQAENQNSENVYVKKVILNGKELKIPLVKHSEVIVGGE